MPGAYLFGWDDDNKKWVKVLVNSEGKLIIDPSEIFEEDPTDGEVGKAPTSNWAHDHEADESAHHGRYTDEEARAAIGNLLDSLGRLTKSLHCNYQVINNMNEFQMRKASDDTRILSFAKSKNAAILYLKTYVHGGGYAPTYMRIHNGTDYEDVSTEPVVDSKISDHASDAQAHHAHMIDYKDPDAHDYEVGITMFYTSVQPGWPVDYATIVTFWTGQGRNFQLCVSYDGDEIYIRSYYTGSGWFSWHSLLTGAHASDASAHHARYTDEEAREACGLDGDLYWSVPGVGFSARYPDIDSVKKAETGQLLVQGDNTVVSAPVCLPHGATVKAAVVTGNASAVAGETWELRRIGLDGGSMESLASARIGTEDTSIANAVIDNENYSYYLVTSSLDTDDEIYGARITYTI